MVSDKVVMFSVNSRFPETEIIGRCRRFVGSWNFLDLDSLGRETSCFSPITRLFPNAGGTH